MPLERQHTSLKLVSSNILDVQNIKSLDNFDCGEESVNNFLQNDAIDKEQKNLFSTTVFYSDDKSDIAGFYSLTSSIVEVKGYQDMKIFKTISTDDEDDMRTISYPAIEIAWLGVNKRFQGQDYGANMLLDLFRTVINVRFSLGIGTTGITVSALAGAVEFYQKYHFGYLHKDYDKVEIMLCAYPMFIPISVVLNIVSELDR